MFMSLDTFVPSQEKQFSGLCGIVYNIVYMYKKIYDYVFDRRCYKFVGITHSRRFLLSRFEYFSRYRHFIFITSVIRTRIMPGGVSCGGGGVVTRIRHPSVRLVVIFFFRYRYCIKF